MTMTKDASNNCGGAPGGALLALLAIAGLMGAGGVTLAAIAAHTVPDASLATAANMMVLHSAAAIAVLACGIQLPRRCFWMAAAALMLIGTLLFSGAIAAGKLAGIALPGVAPAGGMTLIVSWLVVVIAAVTAASAGKRD